MSGKLKEVRERIKSVSSTQQITKAMKMVSAAKLRQAQNAITQMRPYANKLDQMIKNILSNMDGGSDTSFGEEREVQKAAIVVVTSNRGLCGAFNSNVSKAALAKYKDLSHLGENLTFYFVGKKGFDYLKKQVGNATLNRDYVDLFSDLTFDKVAEVADHLMEQFKESEVDEVFVCYGRFKNPGVQFAESAQFLPVEKIEAPTESSDEKKHRADYLFEPSKNELLEQLIPSILQTTFQKYCLDTHASEHGARMTAMDKATENAQELIRDLKITYNKARQEAITKEILEIVGGAAALEG